VDHHHPTGVAALSLTLLLGVSLVVQGAFRIAAALATHADGRGWLLISGLASLLLGIFIWSEWPVSGIWVIGLFVGIDLLFYGWWLVSLALSVRHLPGARRHVSGRVPVLRTRSRQPDGEEDRRQRPSGHALASRCQRALRRWARNDNAGSSDPDLSNGSRGDILRPR